VSLQREVNGRIEKGMPGTDKGGQCLTMWGYQRLVKSYTLVMGQDRFTKSNQPIAIAYRRRDMGNLISPWLALLCVAAELLECLKEERLDIVGLKAARICAFHLLPNAMDFGHVHRVVRQGALLYQVSELGPIKGVVDRLCKPSSHLGQIAVADSFDKQLSQGASFELELTQDVKDLSSQSFAGMLQLFQKLAVNVALSGSFGDEVPKMTYFGLADAMDAAEALLQAVRIPRQVVVHHEMGALEIYSLASSVGREEHLHLGVVPERLL
jgi:hypothetical protein